LIDWLAARGYTMYRITDRGLVAMAGLVTCGSDQFNALFTAAPQLPEALNLRPTA
jgi:hypothetical protein